MRPTRSQFLCAAAGWLVVSSAFAQQQSFDRDFLQTMRAHHQMGLEMARTVEEHVQHKELKQGVRKMIDEHEKDLKRISELLGERGGSAAVPAGSQAIGAPVPAAKDRMPATVMGLAIEGKMDMAKLRQAEPDAHFIKMMIPHHAGAILMSHEAVQKAGSDDVKTFARKLIDGQSKEIGHLRELHAKWYGKL
jgi:uncharacterized protein (DUF305 family)